MQIEPIPFSAFASLISCGQALKNSSNDGCAWYATTDRRVAGRIYFDADSDSFRHSVLHFVRSGWEIKESRQPFERLEEAEDSLFAAMRCESTGKEVTVKDVPLRMRFGKGRTRDATPAAGGNDYSP